MPAQFVTATARTTANANAMTQRYGRCLRCRQVPGLLSSVTLTTIELGGRVLVTKYNADAGLFTQAQLALAGLVSAARIGRSHLHQKDVGQSEKVKRNHTHSMRIVLPHYILSSKIVTPVGARWTHLSRISPIVLE